MNIKKYHHNNNNNNNNNNIYYTIYIIQKDGEPQIEQQQYPSISMGISV